MNISSHGSVLGIDVGFSQKKPSSAVCRFEWTESHVTWRVEHFKAVEPERTTSVTRVAGTGPLLAAAFDGPVRGDLREIGKYRAAEQMLTRRLRRIGKPGQANSPSGRKLNSSTNEFARIVMDRCVLSDATHSTHIHEKAIVEAFPTSFLGLMIDNPDGLDGRRGKRSDTYFERLATHGVLERLISHCLPNRCLSLVPGDITNHDDRAALVCALTAMCVVANDFVAVGDDDGWIVMPPRRFIQAWAFDSLEANERELPGALHFEPRLAAKRARSDSHQERFACPH